MLQGFGAIRTLSDTTDELELLSVTSVTELDVTELLSVSLSICWMTCLTLQRSKSSSSLQDLSLIIHIVSQLSSKDKSSCSLSLSLSNTSHNTPVTIFIPGNLLNYNLCFHILIIPKIIPTLI